MAKGYCWLGATLPTDCTPGKQITGGCEPGGIAVTGGYAVPG